MLTVRDRGFGRVVKFRLFSRLIWNTAEVSGLSAAMYSLVISGMSGLLVPEPPSQITDMETWISAGLSFSGSRRVSVSGRISTSGIAAELYTASPCTWPEDHGRGRFYAAYFTIERVTTGVWSVSRATHIEAHSHGSGCCDLRYGRYLTMWFPTKPSIFYTTGIFLLQKSNWDMLISIPHPLMGNWFSHSTAADLN